MTVVLIKSRRKIKFTIVQNIYVDLIVHTTSISSILGRRKIFCNIIGQKRCGHLVQSNSLCHARRGTWLEESFLYYWPEERVDIVQSNFLKSHISPPFVASPFSNLLWKINVFSTLSVHNVMSSSTFGHFKTLLLSSCGSCPTLNWFSTSTLQIAHKRHAGAKRNIYMVLPAIYEIWVMFQSKGGCMMWQGGKIIPKKTRAKINFVSIYKETLFQWDSGDVRMVGCMMC